MMCAGKTRVVLAVIVWAADGHAIIKIMVSTQVIAQRKVRHCHRACVDAHPGISDQVSADLADMPNPHMITCDLIT